MVFKYTLTSVGGLTSIQLRTKWPFPLDLRTLKNSLGYMAGFTYQCQGHSLNCSTTFIPTKQFWKDVSFIFKINTASHPVNLSNLKIMLIFNLN